MSLPRWVGRAIGLDVHRDFCVVAICEDGQARSSAACRARLMVSRHWRLPCWLYRVALEVTRSCWEVARLLEPHVDRVIVVSPDDTGITQARAED